MNMTLGDTQYIIDEARNRGVLRNQLAYILATAYHETAHTMKPVREYGGEKYLRSKKYYPYVGMGYVQLTWDYNYKKAGDKLGADFIKNPKLLLEPKYASPILIIGMIEGWFTGKKLSDYITLNKSDFKGARRIVNGTDKADLIAGYAREYDAALKVMGYGETVSEVVVADPGELETHPAKSKTVWTWALTAVGTIGVTVGDFLGNLDWRVQLFITACIVGFAAYGIKRRADLFRAVKSLKKELG